MGLKWGQVHAGVGGWVGWGGGGGGWGGGWGLFLFFYPGAVMRSCDAQLLPGCTVILLSHAWRPAASPSSI